MTAPSQAHSLRDYYGIGQEEAPDAPQEKGEVQVPHVVPVEELFASASLDKLLQTTINAIDGIRELQAERQSLVYNHHQELVSASDTVGKMRAGLAALAPQRKALKEQVERLHAQSDALGAGAKEVEEIDWRGDVLTTVQLPITLQEKCKENKRAEAERLWEEHWPRLAAWEAAGVKGASELTQACRDVLQVP
ncbi:hypothetical protein MVES1_001639 [Malassezia vespertilionis]|uniref:Uncharacterized protein n=1 Tax=Malassezia vespertilionis TaxID=2020962 RepID=A0A2N1JCD0_9BASI|nr:uncharacterized protein MVES1_001639 [Malassezia vespertilionis]PKI84221.1 hypothetical protein MVES_001541 [Malassezia vespertilionis]WFD06294.1 hypothetical protein MVES1_001639 [Malassezia vespertilionis]